ncbi:uncharacterized protein [Prorops nasuta]|uniref:uncharacterized protein n=1 Tax=Prorops nasuta TaxID=863751 RepID=UPI0034CDC3FA
MFALVLFSDGIYYICKNADVSYGKNSTSVKYSDGNRYLGEVINIKGKRTKKVEKDHDAPVKMCKRNKGIKIKSIITIRPSEAITNKVEAVINSAANEMLLESTQGSEEKIIELDRIKNDLSQIVVNSNINGQATAERLGEFSANKISIDAMPVMIESRNGINTAEENFVTLCSITADSDTASTTVQASKEIFVDSLTCKNLFESIQDSKQSTNELDISKIKLLEDLPCSSKDGTIMDEAVGILENISVNKQSFEPALIIAENNSVKNSKQSTNELDISKIKLLEDLPCSSKDGTIMDEAVGILENISVNKQSFEPVLIIAENNSVKNSKQSSNEFDINKNKLPEDLPCSSKDGTFIDEADGKMGNISANNQSCDPILIIAENDSLFNMADGTWNDLSVGLFADLSNINDNLIINNKKTEEYKNENLKNNFNSSEFNTENLRNEECYSKKSNSISDKVDSDSSYKPESDSESDDTESQKDVKHDTSKRYNLSNNSCNSLLDDSIINKVPTNAPNDENMFVKTAESGTKKDYCHYCNTEQAKLSRHLYRKHSNVEKVKEFLLIPKNHPERKRLINQIRKDGQYYFNTNTNVNTSELKTMRRPNAKYNKIANDFVVCPNCKGSYAKSSLRHHFRRCAKRNSAKSRSIMTSSRRIAGRVHVKACAVLRNRILPTMRDDMVTRTIRFDDMAIEFANKLCDKYQDPHFYDMIRQKLRQLGRFLIELKSRSREIDDLFSVFYPSNYDLCKSTIQALAGLNESGTGFKTPSLATSLGTLLKQVCKRCITIYIKKEDDKKRKHAERFLQLMTEDYSSSIARTAIETQYKKKRQTTKRLPTPTDIKMLENYLTNNLIKAHDSLKQEFSYSAWLSLVETCLIMIQVFNGRRSGETERALLEDFLNYQKVDESSVGESYATLSEDEKKAAETYVRFTIRGKLGRTVAILVHKQIMENLQLVLKYRKLAKVSEKNPYLFGIPGKLKGDYRYLRACELLRKFSEKCGAPNPLTLRGTNLRKHIATMCVNLELKENEVSELANFMGHAESIHKSHYRQPILRREIFKISKLLEIVHGKLDGIDGSDVDDPGEKAVPMRNISNTNNSANDSTLLESRQKLVIKVGGTDTVNDGRYEGESKNGGYATRKRNKNRDIRTCYAKLNYMSNFTSPSQILLIIISIISDVENELSLKRKKIDMTKKRKKIKDDGMLNKEKLNMEREMKISSEANLKKLRFSTSSKEAPVESIAPNTVDIFMLKEESLSNGDGKETYSSTDVKVLSKCLAKDDYGKLENMKSQLENNKQKMSDSEKDPVKELNNIKDEHYEKQLRRKMSKTVNIQSTKRFKKAAECTLAITLSNNSNKECNLKVNDGAMVVLDKNIDYINKSEREKASVLMDPSTEFKHSSTIIEFCNNTLTNSTNGIHKEDEVNNNTECISAIIESNNSSKVCKLKVNDNILVALEKDIDYINKLKGERGTNICLCETVPQVGSEPVVRKEGLILK